MKVFNWQNIAQLGSKAEILEAIKHAADVAFKMPLIQRGGADAPAAMIKELESIGIKLTGPSSTPNTGNRDVVNTTIVKAAFQDFGFMEIFDMVDMRGIPVNNFEIGDASSTITFSQRKPGGKAYIYEVSDSKATVSYLEFSAGLGFLDVWLQFQQFYKFEDAVNQATRQYYNQMAYLHYALFAALSTGVNQAYDTSDAQTIDNACVQILSDCKSKGYFVSEKPQFIVLCNPAQERRLMKAIWPFTQNANDTTTQPPVNNVSRLVSSWHIANTSYYVILPGNKLKRGVWLDLTSESQRDAIRSAEDIVWKGQYNAAIGDTQQVRRCALS